MRRDRALLAALILGLASASPAATWPYAKNQPQAAAQALGVDARVVAQAGEEELPPELCWMVAKMAQRCGCGVSGVMALRETKSWGEVARACGWDWVALNAEVSRLQQQGALAFEQASRLQLKLGGVNRASRRKQLREADLAAKASQGRAKP
jgi:hypothetical protein